MANWADIGAGFAGAGVGAQTYVRGIREKEDAEFRKEQRGRERKKWEEEDRVKAMESSVRGPGTYDEVSPNDPYGEHVTGKKTTRTIADVQKDRAEGFQRLGLGDRAAQATLQADQFREMERKNALTAKRDEVMQRHAARVKALQAGDFSAAPEMINYYNSKFPDKRNLAYGRGAKGHHLTWLDEETGSVIGSKTLSDEQFMQLALQGSKDMADHELGLVSAEDFGQAHTRGIQRGDLAVKQGMLDVNRREAAVKELVAPSTVEENTAKAGYYRRMPREGGGGSDRNDRWVPLGPDVDGVPVFHNPSDFSMKRLDGKPPMDTKRLYPKLTGERTAPEVPPYITAAFTKELSEAGTDPKTVQKVYDKYAVFGIRVPEDSTIAALKNLKDRPSAAGKTTKSAPEKGVPAPKAESKEDPRVSSRGSNVEFTGPGARKEAPASKPRTNGEKAEHRASFDR